MRFIFVAFFTNTLTHNKQWFCAVLWLSLGEKNTLALNASVLITQMHTVRCKISWFDKSRTASATRCDGKVNKWVMCRVHTTTTASEVFVNLLPHRVKFIWIPWHGIAFLQRDTKRLKFCCFYKYQCL